MIFDEQISRKPDNYPWTQDFIEAMHNGFWTHREFNFSSDVQDFRVNLTEQQKQIIIRALSTIGQLEISVKKFWAKLGDNLPHPSLNDLGYTMAHVEVIHGDAYERLLEVLGIDDNFEKILELDIIKGRVNYLRKHLHKFHQDNKKQFIYSLILFTLFVENIALFSQFYTISYFGRFLNLLKDTNKQVEYTSREENLHAMIGIKIINTIKQEYPELFDKELEDKIIHESKEAVRYECEIIDWIVNGYGEENLNSDLLKEFIKNRLNESLDQIGYEPVFDIDQKLLSKTLWFDEQILGNNMTDFFHSRPVEYSKKALSFDIEALF
ncbi:MAG: ribonucleotide reductase [Alphaproteobacteria bacterium]|jgi:ribonucleoside-diphosphate reductase beta chain|nr:ribonucleotide reductase [Alphaproteobacteria bacterium]